MDGAKSDLLELYLEILDLLKYSEAEDPTADIAVVRTEINRYIRENYTSYNRRR